MQARNCFAILVAGVTTFMSVTFAENVAAQPSDFYVTGDLGVSRYQTSVIQDGIPIRGGSVDKTSNVGGVAAGWRINPMFSLELGYSDFGKAKFSGNAAFPCQPAPSCTPVIAGLTGDYRAKSTHVSLIGMTEVTKELSVFGRIGVSRTKRSASATIGSRSGTADENKTEAISGLGVSYAFTKNIEGTFEWKWLSNTKLSAPTIGVRVGF